MTDQQKFTLALVRDAIIVLFLVLNLVAVLAGHQALETSVLTYAAQTSARQCPTTALLSP